MIIETKHNLEDKVWFMYHDKPTEGIIDEVVLTVNRKRIVEAYWVRLPGGPSLPMSGEDFFPDKRSLIEDLMKD